MPLNCCKSIRAMERSSGLMTEPLSSSLGLMPCELAPFAKLAFSLSNSGFMSVCLSNEIRWWGWESHAIFFCLSIKSGTDIPSAQILEGLSSFLFSIFGQEPWWSLRHKEHGYKEQRRECGQNPCENVPWNKSSDDVSDEDTQWKENCRESTQSTTNSRRRTFANLKFS